MSEASFELCFRGETAEGQVLGEVKRRLGSIFRLPAEQVEQLFSGKEVVLKRGLDSRQAAEYQSAFRRAGALCELRSEVPVLAASFPLDMPVAVVPVVASAAPLSPAATVAVPRAMIDAAVRVEAEMTCPKCGLAQAKQESCAACGVVVARAAERLAQAENRDQLLRSLVGAHHGRIQSPRIFFGPHIPAEKLQNALAVYEDPYTLWGNEDKESLRIDPDEEILLLVDTTLSKGNAKSNILLTAKRLLTVDSMLVATATGFPIELVRTSSLGGLGKSTLTINNVKINLGTGGDRAEIDGNSALAGLFQELIALVQYGKVPECVSGCPVSRACASDATGQTPRNPAPRVAPPPLPSGIPDAPESGVAAASENPPVEEEKAGGGFFGAEKKGIEKGMAGGIAMMVIAAIWFFVGLKMDIVFFYPPILFLIGLYAFIKGMVTGNTSGKS